MSDKVNVSLPAELIKKVDAAAKRKGVTRSQFIQETLKHDLFREHLYAAREIGVPMARRKGFYTDEDIFKVVS